MSINFNGKQIHASKQSVHLGHIIGPDRDTMKSAVQKVVGELYGRLNLLLSQFHKCTYDTLFHLFNTFCMCLYGALLWDFSSDFIDKLYVAWRKCIRRIYNLHPRTHCNLLPYITSSRSIELVMHQRLFNFIMNCNRSKNVLIKTVTRTAMNGSNSTLGKNINMLKLKYSVNFNQFVTLSNGIVNDDINTVGILIRDLLDYEVACRGDDKENVRFMIDHLCTQ